VAVFELAHGLIRSSPDISQKDGKGPQLLA
jgi:hypothetical protein